MLNFGSGNVKGINSHSNKNPMNLSPILIFELKKMQLKFITSYVIIINDKLLS